MCCFKPSGRRDTTKISDMVLALAREIPNLPEKKYVVTMDNYFTVPDEIVRLRE